MNEVINANESDRRCSTRSESNYPYEILSIETVDGDSECADVIIVGRKLARIENAEGSDKHDEKNLNIHDNDECYNVITTAPVNDKHSDEHSNGDGGNGDDDDDGDGTHSHSAYTNTQHTPDNQHNHCTRGVNNNRLTILQSNTHHFTTLNNHPLDNDDDDDPVEVVVNIKLKKRRRKSNLSKTNEITEAIRRCSSTNFTKMVVSSSSSFSTSSSSPSASSPSFIDTIIGSNLRSSFSKHLVLILVVISSILALVLLHNGSLRTRKVPNPTPFFNTENSLITDFDHGQLKELWSKIQKNEVSFVMYYAPWDSECIRARTEIEIVANQYGQSIFFAAINCWWPDGECRKSHTITRYPRFVANIRFGGEIEYNGPVLASYIIPFLDSVLTPIVPIQNEGDLLDLRSKHVAVVMAYFDHYQISTLESSYRLYMSVALKALIRDPWRSAAFTIVTNERVLQKIHLDSTKESTLTLFVGNETEYFTLKSSTPQSILSWIYSRADGARTLRWFNPNGVKSKVLTDYLKVGPTLILFTPRSFILGISPYFDLLKEIVLDYFNCDNSPTIRSLIHRNILRRRLQKDKLSELEELCHELLDDEQSSREESSKDSSSSGSKRYANNNEDTCCHSQVVNWRSYGSARRGMSKKCLCTSCVHISIPKCPARCSRFDCLGTATRYLDDFDPNSVNTSAIYCNQIKSTYEPKYTPYYKISTTCSGTIMPTNVENDEDGYFYSGTHSASSSPSSSSSSSSSSYTIDDRINRMIQDTEVEHCRRLKLGMNYTDLNFPDSSDLHNRNLNRRANFTGLGCRTNRSLEFVALDSILYPAFAESLGIDMFNMPHSTVMLIVDSSNENVHLLNHEILFEEVELQNYDTKSIVHVPINSYSKQTFMEFIGNFTVGSLPRFQRSQFVHYSSGLCDLQQLIRNDHRNPNETIICVPELNTVTFTHLIGGSLEDENSASAGGSDAGSSLLELRSTYMSRDVLVMYYAPWCGFCSSIAHIYLDIARAFAFSNDILFTRINGDANDLAWEYTVDRYPTIVFFPGGNRINSITYPPSKAVTKSGLLQFILNHGQASVRIEIMLMFCEGSCLMNSAIRADRMKRSIMRSQRHNQHSYMLCKYRIDRILKRINSIPSNNKQMNMLHKQHEQSEQHLRRLRVNLRQLQRLQRKQQLIGYFLLKQSGRLMRGEQSIRLMDSTRELYDSLYPKRTKKTTENKTTTKMKKTTATKTTTTTAATSSLPKKATRISVKSVADSIRSKGGGDDQKKVQKHRKTEL